MMYSIHGDELSGTDASLQVAYQMAAGNDEQTRMLRRELLVGIDPMENPDGRERFLAQMQQWNSRMESRDAQSIQHTGIWPWGRTNHYLFDLNRDWFILGQPETRARVKALKTWNPQLVVDAHEMGSYDTYLFPPPREPFNPHYSPLVLKWMNTFAADHARAFDQYGWSYYTREWNEEWYPGYGSSWPVYNGAVGILYEQASTEGTAVKKPDGTILTFREAVHHQFVSSIANLTTAAAHRAALLNDFYEMKNAALSFRDKSAPRVYYIVPGDNPSRANRLIERLLLQQVEIERAEADFQAVAVRSYWEDRENKRQFPKGTFIIRLNQPLQPLINAILEFDPRMSGEFINSEREWLEKGKGTRLYEVSAWSMPMAYGVEAYVSTTPPAVKTTAVEQIPRKNGEVSDPQPAYGFVLDYRDDRAIPALLQFLEGDYRVRVAREPFRVEGQTFGRGSLLLRATENPDNLPEKVRQISETTGVTFYGVNTALSEEGPDLGGNEFPLLTAPRIALLSGPGIDTYSFGALWYLLDYELGLRFSILDESVFEDTDLRRYNVLILPSTWEGPETYQKLFQKTGIETLKDWIAAGGTLIGIQHGAAFLADSATSLSEVCLRRQALKDLPLYEAALANERRIGKTAIDSAAFWRGEAIDTTPSQPETESESGSPEEKMLQTRDERERLFMPRGAILRVNLDQEHWLNFGVGERVPAIVYTSYVYLSRDSVQTAGRFSEAPALRLSGLLWPEARHRWENSAYVTRESRQKGQIILFAGDPTFRSYFYGTGRILINAMILGPGLGTEQPVGW